ncbi:MAG: glycosyltransferase family 2 protein [Candidatus Kapaibacterium sp.]
MKVLLIIPAYNESTNITRLLVDIGRNGNIYDTLVVNDGSEDDTAVKARHKGAKVLDLPMNLGIGGAVQTGYHYAYSKGYDAAVQVDGDGQHSPEFIKKLIEPIENGEADMVIGSRFIENNGFQSSFFRRIGIGYFRGLIRFITGQSISDPTSGFRACNRAVIEAFTKYYPADYPEPESIVFLKRKKFRIKEVPVQMRERNGGISSIRAFRIPYYMIKVTLAILIDKFKKK